jgi:hypothetical protein
MLNHETTVGCCMAYASWTLSESVKLIWLQSANNLRTDFQIHRDESPLRSLHCGVKVSNAEESYQRKFPALGDRPGVWVGIGIAN